MKDSLRAVVAAAHLSMVFVVALPRAMVTPEDLEQEEVQAWFSDRSRDLAAMGFPVSTDGLIERAVWWGGGYEAVRKVLVYPASKYALWTGARQSWRMFGDVPRHSAFFFVEARRGDRWEPLYVARSSDAVWRRSFFDQERPRTFLNQFTYRKNRAAWKRFTGWLDDELRAAHPDVRAFRAGWQEVRFPDPASLSQTRTVEIGDRFWVASLGPRDEQ